MTSHLQAQIILHAILRLGYISIIGCNVIYNLWFQLSDVPQWSNTVAISNLEHATSKDKNFQSYMFRCYGPKLLKLRYSSNSRSNWCNSSTKLDHVAEKKKVYTKSSKKRWDDCMSDSPTLANRFTELVRTDTKFHSSPTSAVVMCVVRRERKGMCAWNLLLTAPNFNCKWNTELTNILHTLKML
jgi:hypothetical protein